MNINKTTQENTTNTNIFTKTEQMNMYKRELIKGQIAQIESLKHILQEPCSDEKLYNTYAIYQQLRVRSLSTQVCKQIAKTICIKAQDAFKDNVPLLGNIPFDRIRIELTTEEYLSLVQSLTDKNAKAPHIVIASIKAMVTDMIGDSPLEFIQQSLKSLGTPAQDTSTDDNLHEYYNNQEFQEKMEDVQQNQQHFKIVKEHPTEMQTEECVGDSTPSAFSSPSHHSFSVLNTPIIANTPSYNDFDQLTDAPTQHDVFSNSMWQLVNDEALDIVMSPETPFDEVPDMATEQVPAESSNEDVVSLPHTPGSNSAVSDTDNILNELSTMIKPAQPRKRGRK